jgi:hypothetical protein
LSSLSSIGASSYPRVETVAYEAMRDWLKSQANWSLAGKKLRLRQLIVKER